jgi:hypothetical protein
MPTFDIHVQSFCIAAYLQTLQRMELDQLTQLQAGTSEKETAMAAVTAAAARKKAASAAVMTAESPEDGLQERRNNALQLLETLREAAKTGMQADVAGRLEGAQRDYTLAEVALLENKQAQQQAYEEKGTSFDFSCHVHLYSLHSAHATLTINVQMCTPQLPLLRRWPRRKRASLRRRARLTTTNERWTR